MKRVALRWALAGVVGGAVLAGYRFGRADGVPAAETLVYSGLLEEGGARVTGERSIRASVWDAPTAGTEICLPRVATLSVAGGAFRIPLGDDCAAAVHDHPDAFLQLTIDNTTLPRIRLSAVPYALEAERAVSAGGPLQALLESIQGALVPVGTIHAFAGSTAPSGWRLCNGDEVQRADFPALFSVVGEAYGRGDGMSTFRLPDLRGRVPVGLGMHADVDTLGKGDAVDVTMRRVSHKHTVNDPQHSHGVNDSGHGHGVNDPGHTHGVHGFYIQAQGGLAAIAARFDGPNGNVGGIEGSGTGISIQGSGANVSVRSAGTGISVGDQTGASNIIPFVVVNYIIKT